MSVQKSLEKQMYPDRKNHATTDTFQIDEQANSNDSYMFDGQPINNKTEEEQVCICEEWTEKERKEKCRKRK
jgi:hypothetical protein